MPEPETKPVTVVDASGLVLGRAASLIAKKLLRGEAVSVINADKSVIVGSKEAILREFRERRARGGLRKGPWYPRMPDKIFKRAVRGMLPYQKGNGRAAYKRLRVYIGVPADLKNVKPETLEPSRCRSAVSSMSLGSISQHLGANITTK